MALYRALEKIFPGLKKYMYGMSGFNQYGLMLDDLVAENDDVKEALRRLPAHLRDERTFRIVRALQLDCQKSILPKEQWTKFEEDVHYLQPYLQEVIKERKEKEKWYTEKV